VTEPPIPDWSEKESDEAWGDEPHDDDARLESERPPHYDR